MDEFVWPHGIHYNIKTLDVGQSGLLPIQMVGHMSKPHPNYVIMSHDLLDNVGDGSLCPTLCKLPMYITFKGGKDFYSLCHGIHLLSTSRGCMQCILGAVHPLLPPLQG